MGVVGTHAIMRKEMQQSSPAPSEALPAGDGGERMVANDRTKGAGVAVQPLCVITDASAGGLVAFQVAITTTYTKPKSSLSRMVWSFSCNKDGGRCTGVYLTLDDADAGQPIDYFDLGSIEGATLVSVKGSRAVIEWGPYRLFTVDVAEKRVTYVESGEDLEGRGESPCKGLLEP
jgi:hypothetical protein